MTLPRAARNALLVAHVAGSVGFMGAIACFLALAVVGMTAGPLAARSAYVAMEVVTLWVVLPLGALSLASGFIEGLGTRWGLFRHYWVIAKLVVTTLAIAVLMAKLGLIRRAASIAAVRSFTEAERFNICLQLLVHAAGGLGVLMIALVLSIYKPRGIR